MNKLLKDNKQGIAPVIILIELVLVAISALGWTFVLGNILVALGMTGSTFILYKAARKKYFIGVLCILIVMATILIAYAWFIGLIVI